MQANLKQISIAAVPAVLLLSSASGGAAIPAICRRSCATRSSSNPHDSVIDEALSDIQAQYYRQLGRGRLDERRRSPARWRASATPTRPTRRRPNTTSFNNPAPGQLLRRRRRSSSLPRWLSHRGGAPRLAGGARRAGRGRRDHGRRRDALRRTLRAYARGASIRGRAGTHVTLDDHARRRRLAVRARPCARQLAGRATRIGLAASSSTASSSG